MVVVVVAVGALFNMKNVNLNEIFYNKPFHSMHYGQRDHDPSPEVLKLIA